jgi:squalene-associated FAD-dependent desaturase
MKPSVAVVGGGWAGMVAARDLALAGAQVTLLERRAQLGGRAFSFFDSRMDSTLDNGQHVLLGCCREMTALLRDLGLSHAVSWQEALDIPVWVNRHWSQLFSAKHLPGMMHLLPGLMRYQGLSGRERLRALHVGWAMTQAHMDDRLDQQSFATWLQKRGQSARAIVHLWDLVGVSVLNCHAERLSAKAAIEAFRIGVLPGADAARMGLFTQPLGDLARSMGEELDHLGVTVRLLTAVQRLEVEDGQVLGLVIDGTIEPVRRVVAAVPHDALARLLAASHGGLTTTLQWSGIVNWYVRFAEPVFSGTVFALADALSPFVFNRGKLLDPQGPEDGRLLAISISDAPDELGQGLALRQTLGRRLAEAIPDTQRVPIEAERVVRQPHATFRAAPHSQSSRALPRAGIRGLYLAGDWTDTGWPASLEGAVRSGQAASRALLADG